GSTPNAANFYDATAGFAVSGSTNYNKGQNYLTEVGGYTASASPYGTFDQGGDVFQWNEALISESFRVVRGGSWDNFSDLSNDLSASNWVTAYPTDVDWKIGFRIAAAVPEPGALVLCVLAGLGLAATRVRQSWIAG